MPEIRSGKPLDYMSAVREIVKGSKELLDVLDKDDKESTSYEDADSQLRRVSPGAYAMRMAYRVWIDVLQVNMPYTCNSHTPPPQAGFGDPRASALAQEQGGPPPGLVQHLSQMFGPGAEVTVHRASPVEVLRSVVDQMDPRTALAALDALQKDFQGKIDAEASETPGGAPTPPTDLSSITEQVPPPPKKAEENDW